SRPLISLMDSEGVSSTTRMRQCLVCCVPVDSVHLGMDVCRACSSFFKRTWTLGRSYPCRRGDHECDTVKEGKLGCRSCRFDKCIAVGLMYEGANATAKETSNFHPCKGQTGVQRFGGASAETGT
ncbi:hypothetical protein PFISCL1PPCAC_28514, partial [Pristionchus fissidentatus]